jgi:hypothetical protein
MLHKLITIIILFFIIVAPVNANVEFSWEVGDTWIVTEQSVLIRPDGLSIIFSNKYNITFVVADIIDFNEQKCWLVKSTFPIRFEVFTHEPCEFETIESLYSVKDYSFVAVKKIKPGSNCPIKKMCPVRRRINLIMPDTTWHMKYPILGQNVQKIQMGKCYQNINKTSEEIIYEMVDIGKMPGVMKMIFHWKPGEKWWNKVDLYAGDQVIRKFRLVK